MKIFTNGVLSAVLLIHSLPAFADEAKARKDDDKDDDKVISYELTKTIEFEQKLGGCAAKLELEFWQKGEQVFVTSRLDNPDCAASSGDYTIHVRYRDEQGETTTDKYEETWEREDDSPVIATKQYDIKKNVDLRSVRSMGLSCQCVNGDQ